MNTRLRTMPFIAVLAGLWLAATGFMTVSRVGGITGFDGFGQVAGLAFIALLILHLGRARPAAVELPPVEPIAFSGLGFGAALAGILAATVALFGLGLLAHPWLVLIFALDLISMALIVAYRDALTWRLGLFAIAAAGVCLSLSAAAGRLDGYQGFYLASVALIVLGGGLLLSRSGLSRIHLVQGDFRTAAHSFVAGCLLAVPAALLNVSDGSHPEDAWIDRAWEPVMALVPGIAEESWARLCLLTLIYVLLRPTCRERPARALAIAVGLSSLIHALAHLPSALVFSPAALPAVIAAVLYGLPMGLLFVKRGFEAAAGYHFFVDLLRFLVAFWQGG